jgi:hypothetical protein
MAKFWRLIQDFIINPVQQRSSSNSNEGKRQTQARDLDTPHRAVVSSGIRDPKLIKTEAGRCRIDRQKPCEPHLAQPGDETRGRELPL